MVRQRESQAEQQAKKMQAFVSGAEKNNLKSLSLDELAYRFEDIGQQAQLMQGQILLEARSRFPSDKEFGRWRSRSLWACSQSQCTRLIQLARFFSESRPLENIGITVAYEISAPANADIADEIYAYAKENKPSIAEIKKQIAIRKGESIPLPTKLPEPATDITPVTPKAATDISEKVEIISTNLVNNSTELSLEQKIMQLVENEIPQAAIVALKNVIDELNKKRYKK